jgi:predicted  nucleic acid-binding Zn-ribbon protein
VERDRSAHRGLHPGRDHRGGVEPGAALAEAGIDLSAKLAAAQSRIDSLLRRADTLEDDLAAARRNLARAAADERRRIGERDAELGGEITRLEGSLAEARAEVRRAEEATRGVVSEGKRAIEIE